MKHDLIKDGCKLIAIGELLCYCSKSYLITTLIF